MKNEAASRPVACPPVPVAFSRQPAKAGYQIATGRQAALMQVTVSGRPSIDQLVSTIHILGIESESPSCEVMVVDLRGLDVEYDRPDLLRIGHEIACSFAHLERLALLVPPRRVTRISERAAQRAGMNMRVFDMESLALSWLRPADGGRRQGSEALED